MNSLKQLRQKCGLCGKDHNVIIISYLNGYETLYILFGLELTLFSLIKDYFDYKYLISFKEFFNLVKHLFFSNIVHMRYDCSFCEVSSHWKLEDNKKTFKSLDSKQYEHLWFELHLLHTHFHHYCKWILEQRDYLKDERYSGPDYEYVYHTEYEFEDKNCYNRVTYEEACKAYKSYKNCLIFG